MLIGLTGSMAAGKSTAARILAEHGYAVIDADEIAHETLSDPEIVSALCKEFGEGILSPDGAIDRRSLSREAFGSGRADDLNRITHPAIKRELFRRAREQEAEKGCAVLDVPLLIESGLNKDCDCVILVTSDIETRYRRIMLRDGLSRSEARQRIAAQMPQWKKKRYANFIVENDGDEGELEEKLLRVLEKLDIKGEGNAFDRNDWKDKE